MRTAFEWVARSLQSIGIGINGIIRLIRKNCSFTIAASDELNKEIIIGTYTEVRFFY